MNALARAPPSPATWARRPSLAEVQREVGSERDVWFWPRAPDEWQSLAGAGATLAWQAWHATLSQAWWQGYAACQHFMAAAAPSQPAHGGAAAVPQMLGPSCPASPAPMAYYSASPPALQVPVPSMATPGLHSAYPRAMSAPDHRSYLDEPWMREEGTVDATPACMPQSTTEPEQGFEPCFPSLNEALPPSATSTSPAPGSTTSASGSTSSACDTPLSSCGSPSSWRDSLSSCDTDEGSSYSASSTTSSDAPGTPIYERESAHSWAYQESDVSCDDEPPVDLLRRRCSFGDLHLDHSGRYAVHAKLSSPPASAGRFASREI
ncbi:hypothetical protein HDZ31DRAFT_67145 [Schizophyllum fasciatum]